MKNKSEIMKIIQQLEHHIADDFEAQDLDFKQWNYSAVEENINKMIKYAVCMVNGGGGSVVFNLGYLVLIRTNTIPNCGSTRYLF